MKARVEFITYEGKSEKTFKVQFNPAELKFQAVLGTGEPEYKNTPLKKNFQMNKGEEPRQIAAEVPEGMDVTMTVKLILDDSLDKNGSVRGEVEGFLAAQKNPVYKYVEFHWNRLHFAGELSGVSAEYVMFHPGGEPARANLTFSVKNQKGQNKRPLWEDKYKSVFEGQN